MSDASRVRGRIQIITQDEKYARSNSSGSMLGKRGDDAEGAVAFAAGDDPRATAEPGVSLEGLGIVEQCAEIQCAGNPPPPEQVLRRHGLRQTIALPRREVACACTAHEMRLDSARDSGDSSRVASAMCLPRNFANRLNGSVLIARRETPNRK